MLKNIVNFIRRDELSRKERVSLLEERLNKLKGIGITLYEGFSINDIVNNDDADLKNITENEYDELIELLGYQVGEEGEFTTYIAKEISTPSTEDLYCEVFDSITSLIRYELDVTQYVEGINANETDNIITFQCNDEEITWKKNVHDKWNYHSIMADVNNILKQNNIDKRIGYCEKEDTAVLVFLSEHKIEQLNKLVKNKFMVFQRCK